MSDDNNSNDASAAQPDAPEPQPDLGPLGGEAPSSPSPGPAPKKPAGSSKIGSTTGKHFVPPTPEDLDAVLDNYEFLEIVGKGGMGAVYKARQKNLNRIVAIKVLPAHLQVDDDGMNFAKRFKQEARAMAQLSHPNILQVYDVGEATDGQLYIVMEFVEGTDLHQLIRGKQLTVEHFYGWIPPICDALFYAHSQGIIHRDIKPSNIMINSAGQIKIADFGLAKLIGGDHALTTKLTMTNVAMGTPDYVAPEQLIEGAEVDHRADLYSLGILLYEMLTGSVPRGRTRRPSTKNPALDKRRPDEVVFKAIEESPDDRFQNAGEISTAITTIQTTPPPTPAEPPAGGTGPVMVKRKPKLVTGSVEENAAGSAASASPPRGATSPVRPAGRPPRGATAPVTPRGARQSGPGAGTWIGLAAGLALLGIVVGLVLVNRGREEVDAGESGIGTDDTEIAKADPPKTEPKPTPKTTPPTPRAEPKPEPKASDSIPKAPDIGEMAWSDLISGGDAKLIEAKLAGSTWTKNEGNNLGTILRFDKDGKGQMSFPPQLGKEALALTYRVESGGKVPFQLSDGFKNTLELRDATETEGGIRFFTSDGSGYFLSSDPGPLTNPDSPDASKDDVGWIDLLSMVDLEKDTLKGNFERTPDGAITDTADSDCYLAVPQADKGNVEIEIELACLNGDRGAWVTIPHEERAVPMLFTPTAIGVRGTKTKTTFPEIPLFEPFRARLMLDRETPGVLKLKATLNGKHEYSWSSDSDTVAFHGLSEHVCIGTVDNATYRFDAIRIRGDQLRKPEADDSLPDSKEGWIDVLSMVDLEENLYGNPNHIRRNANGSLESLGAAHAVGITLPAPGVTSYQFRATFEQLEGQPDSPLRYLSIFFPISELNGVVHFGGGSGAATIPADGAKKDPVEKIETGREYEVFFEFEEISDQEVMILVRIDNLPVLQWSGNPGALTEHKWQRPPTGFGFGFSEHVIARFSSVEVRSMTKQPLAFAPEPPPPQTEVDRQLSEVEAQFRERYRTEVLAGHSNRVESLNQQYLGALGRAEDAASAAANLDGVLAIQAEKKRVENGDALPETDDPKKVPASVIGLRKTYRAQIGKLEQTREAAVKELAVEYDKALDTVQRDFTSEAKIEEALKVKAVRDAVTNGDRRWLGGETSGQSLPKVASTKEGLREWLMTRSISFQGSVRNAVLTFSPSTVKWEASETEVNDWPYKITNERRVTVKGRENYRIEFSPDLQTGTLQSSQGKYELIISPGIPKTKEELAELLVGTIWEKIAGTAGIGDCFVFVASDQVFKHETNGTIEAFRVAFRAATEFEIGGRYPYELADSGKSFKRMSGEPSEYVLKSRDPNYRSFAPIAGSEESKLAWFSNLGFASPDSRTLLKFADGETKVNWNGRDLEFSFGTVSAGRGSALLEASVDGKALKLVLHEHGRWMHAEGEAVAERWQGRDANRIPCEIWIRKDIHEATQRELARRKKPTTKEDLEQFLIGTRWARVNTNQTEFQFSECEFMPEGTVAHFTRENSEEKAVPWEVLDPKTAEFGRFRYRFAETFDDFDAVTPDGKETAIGVLLNFVAEE